MKIVKQFDYRCNAHICKRHTDKITEALVTVVTKQRKKEKNEIKPGYHTLERMNELVSSAFHDPYDQTINASVRSDFCPYM